MRQRILILIAAVLGTLACTSFGLGPSPSQPPAGPGMRATEAPARPGAATAPNDLLTNPLPSVGRLAVEGLDGNLYVVEQNKPPVQVSTDGIPFDVNNRGRIYAHPTWSPQGWLSYVREITTGSGPSQLDLMAIPPDQANPITILNQPDGGYIYGYWSPSACSSGLFCGRFAFLVGSDDQIALHLAEVTHDKVTIEDAVGLASPFYFSWSPDGNDMLWHRNTTDLTVYDAENRQIGERLPDTAGIFQSPAWSPSDNRWLFARVEHNANQLTIAQDSQRSNVGGPSGEGMFFNWSPDGNYVASATGEYPLSGLTLTHVGTSSSVEVKELEAVVGFFWAPDSSQLAVITVEESGQKLPQANASTRLDRAMQQDSGDIDLVWSLIDVATDKVTRLGAFFPTPEEFYILRYFDQYSQSHRVWSPDSRYLVYAERRSESSPPVISLLDTLAPGKAPIELMQGVQAVYSFMK